MRTAITILLLVLAVAWGDKCRPGDLKTDRVNRDVYRCDKYKTWQFHARMMRPVPREAMPIHVSLSNSCENNADLSGAIAGFTCNTSLHLNVLNCLNTKYAYICMDNEWSVYMIHDKLAAGA